MKNIFKTLIFVFGLVVFNACDSDLEQLPNDSLSPASYYNNVGDFETAMRGVYSGFFGSGYYGGVGGSLVSLPDIMTDNVILAPAGRRSNQNFYEWRQAPNLAWDMMTRPYVATNRANLIIANIDKLPDGAEKNNFLGEARAARALALFDMARVYSKIPTQSADANSGLGMPIIVETDPNIRKLRPTVAETYEFIIDEFEAAKGLINADNGVGRFNKNAISALLSRAYLYSGKYPEAITAANAVTTPIATIANFPGVWLDSNEDGVILKFDQDRILDQFDMGVDWSQSVGSTLIPEYVQSFELANLYQSNDVRNNAFSQILADGEGNIYNAITKMFGEAGQNNGYVDPKIIRVAEVFLNKAEAHAMIGGQDAQALAALDVVRSNRYSGFVSPGETGAALLDAIKLERRLELFAEGHRYFDLKRWGEGVSRSATDGEFFDGTGTPPAFTDLPAGSHKFEMPIPQAEINVYPEFQQNPGY